MFNIVTARTYPVYRCRLWHKTVNGQQFAGRVFGWWPCSVLLSCSDGLMFSSGAARASRGSFNHFNHRTALYWESKCELQSHVSLIPTISVSFLFCSHNERKVTCKHPVTGVPSQDNCIFVVSEQWVIYFSLFVSCSIESETERFVWTSHRNHIHAA